MSPFIALLRRLGGDRVVAVVLAGLGAVIALIQIVEAILFGRVVNALTTGSGALPLLGAWAGLGSVGIGLNVALALMADRLAHRYRLVTLSDAFERSLAGPAHSRQLSGQGELIRNILIGSDAAFAFWLSFFREQIPAISAVVILFPIAFGLNPILTAALAVVIGMLLTANVLIVRKTSSGQKQVDLHHRALSSRINDVVANAGVVHAFTRMHQETTAIRQMTRNILKEQYPVLNWWAVLAVFTRAAATVSVVTVFLVGTWLVGRGILNIGEVVTFAGFATILIARLEQATGAVTRLFPQRPVVAALVELLEADTGAEDDATLPPLAVKGGAIDLHHVSFTFPGTEGGLQDVSLSIAPGQSLALCGPTGSGKTTLISLIQGIFPVTAGRILIDGTDIRTVRKSSLRAAISVVAQEAGLFNRSVADNLRLAKPDASTPEMMDALARAQFLDVLDRKGEGLDFQIGERGSRLSGGERQRLSIARALLKDAPILILDEATSALDTGTEALVQRALEEVSRGRTTVIIAHRLTTIRHVDRIAVLERGVVEQVGTYDDLAAVAGPFRRLLSAANRPSPAVTAELEKLSRQHVG